MCVLNKSFFIGTIAAFVLLGCMTFSTYANVSQPALIDYRVSGHEQAPYFVPEILNLHVGTPYLLVIDNQFEDNINFVYGKFGQITYTHYLQGVSGISQNSMSIPAGSKITWLLEINEPGEFLVYAMNMSNGQRGPTSKLIVKSRHQIKKSTLPDFTSNETLVMDEEVDTDSTSTQSEENSRQKKLKRPRFGGRQDG